MSVLREQPRENYFRNSFVRKYKSTIAVDKYYLIYKKSKNKRGTQCRWEHYYISVDKGS